jgi:hypothetical protein
MRSRRPRTQQKLHVDLRLVPTEPTPAQLLAWQKLWALLLAPSAPTEDPQPRHVLDSTLAMEKSQTDRQSHGTLRRVERQNEDVPKPHNPGTPER